MKTAAGPDITLEELSAVVRDLDGRTSAAEIPEILLDALCRVFGFGRGVVLASPEGDLSLMAYRGPGDPPDLPPGHDRVTERAYALVARSDRAPVHEAHAK